jgi:hypothetical protein
MDLSLFSTDSMVHESQTVENGDEKKQKATTNTDTTTLQAAFHKTSHECEKINCENVAKLVDHFDTWIFDCDGVLWQSSRILPGVYESLQLLRDTVDLFLHFLWHSSLMRSKGKEDLVCNQQQFEFQRDVPKETGKNGHQVRKSMDFL